MPTATNNKYALAATDSEIKKAKAALETNGFKVLVVDNLQQAKNKVEEHIPSGS